MFEVTNNTPKEGLQYVQSLQDSHQNEVNDVVLLSILLPLNIFYTFS